MPDFLKKVKGIANIIFVFVFNLFEIVAIFYHHQNHLHKIRVKYNTFAFMDRVDIFECIVWVTVVGF